MFDIVMCVELNSLVDREIRITTFNTPLEASHQLSLALKKVLSDNQCRIIVFCLRFILTV